MTPTINLYIDDSGTRHPDHRLDTTSDRPDWFALGGVLVKEEDEGPCRKLHADFSERWGLEAPLHSEEIRYFKKNFRWLKSSSQEKRERFMTDLQRMLVRLPVMGISCVIDRRGYHNRYHTKYGTRKWSLCKSAFTIGVERASKYAQSCGRRLNVYVERSDKKTDARIRQYFDELRGHGHPFDAGNAARYSPLSQCELRNILYDFRLKNKSSALMQVADLYLYPMCRGGYSDSYRPHVALREHRRLIDSHVSDATAEGIKYYCFENIRPE